MKEHSLLLKAQVLHFKFRYTSYWRCCEPAMSTLLARKQSSRQKRQLVGTHWSAFFFFISFKEIISFWEKNSEVQLHRSMSVSLFFIPKSQDCLSEVVTVIMLLRRWSWIRGFMTYPNHLTSQKKNIRSPHAFSLQTWPPCFISKMTKREGQKRAGGGCSTP